jgi:hypothetical protein
LRGRHEARRELVELLQRPATDFKTWFVDEPPLEFGNGQGAADPKTGVTLYGPCGTDQGSPLAQIRVGLIGVGETIQQAQQWLDRCRVPEGLIEKLSTVEVARCTAASNRDAAVEAMGAVLSAKLQNLKDRERSPDVVIIALS